MNRKSAIAAIEKSGVLLVYPIHNRKEPPSIWSSFFPRSPMRWEWDQEGDDRVADLWHLREELSRSGQVVYAKWYQGRATFFSQQIFTAMLAALGTPARSPRELSSEARQIYELLSMDSPLSTKQIKQMTELRGKAYESTYEKALKSLWQRLMIVGFGEVDEGAFPSLAIGATRVLFEDLWNEAQGMSREEGMEILRAKLPEGSHFLKYLDRMLKKIQVAEPQRLAIPQQISGNS